MSAPVFDQSNITGTSQQVSGLANNTIYYWQVNAKNSGGTSVYSGAWSFTTILAPPAAPTLASPANAATGIVTNPTLSWNAVTGATSYQLQVSANSDLSAPIFNQSNITSTSQQVSGLANNTTYYWHVNATNAGGTSAWSLAWNFTTLSSSLPAPTLASPANGATAQPTSLSFQWNAVTGATSYRLQISTSLSFGSLFIDVSGIELPSSTVSGLSPNTTYYWRVYAMNGTVASLPSQAWSFTTGTPPLAAPILGVPFNGANSQGSTAAPQPLQMVFAWYSVTGAGQYDLQISTDPSFNSKFYDQTAYSPGVMVQGLAPSTQYYWRVNASDWNGKLTSDWSEVRSFTTNGPIQDLTPSPDFQTEAWLPADGTGIAGMIAGVTRPDGKVRIVVGTYSTGRLYVYLYDGTNYQVEWSGVIAPNAEIVPTAIGDVDNDGVPEIIVSVWPNGSWPSDGKIHVVKWTGLAYAEVFSQQVDANVGSMPAAIKDLDGDGKNELVLVGSQINIFRYSQASTSFEKLWSTPVGAYALWSTIQVSVGDVDGDGRPEVVVPVSLNTFDPNPPSSKALLVIGYNGSSYAVKSEVSGFIQSLGGVAIGDFDGDGKQEMITGVYNVALGSYPIYLVKYNGASYAVNQIGASPYGMYLAHAGDIDGDGRADANIFRNSGGSYFVSYKSGTYQVSLVGQAGGALSGDLVDTDHDGKAEILTQGSVVGYDPYVPLAAPTLASPANGATGVATNPTLQWNPASGATSYRVQVSTDQTFASWWGDSGPISQTSYSFSNLSYSTTYYWRVTASNGSATSPPSAVWGFTTTAFPAPVLAIPANGATGQGTSQDIVWYPVTGAYSYRLQISDNPSFTPPLFLDQSNLGRGWVASGLASNHTYYWRVNALSGGGSSDWSETWSFTTRGAIQDLPQSNSFAVEGSIPGDGSWIPATVAGVTRADDSRVRLVVGSASSGRLYVYVYNGTTYQLEWSDVIAPGAEIFPVAIGDADNDGKPEIVVSIWPNPSNGASDKKIHLYQWNGTAYAQVMEQQLDFMNWGYLTVAIKDLDGDGKNELVATADQINILRYSQTTNTFQPVWTSPTAAYNFSNGIQVSVGDVDGDGRPEIVASTSIDAFSTNPSSEVGLVIVGFDGSSYSVKAELRGFAQGLGGVAIGDFDGDHQAEMITGVFNYAIGSYPIYCIKYNGGGYTISQIASSPWGMYQAHAADIDGDGVADADMFRSTNSSYFVKYVAGSYQVQVVPYIGSVVFGDLADADQDGRAEIIAGGQVVGWQPPLVAPVLSSPANTATGVATNPTLQWNAESGVTSYRVQVSTDQTFASWWGDSGPISQTSYSFSNLWYSTTYYWRVYASNASTTSPPSAVWSFTTTSFPAPVLAIPAKASTGIAPVQNIVWYPVSGATSYHLQVSLDSNFNTTPFIDVPNSWGAWTAYGLALDTVYYWRANATKGTVTSPWSDMWSFRTMKTLPVLTPSDSFQVSAVLHLDGTANRAAIAGVTRPDGKVRIVAGSDHTGSLYVYLFDGTNYQVEWSGVIAQGAQIVPTAIGDFDNDGMPEILVNIWPQPGYAPSDGKIHMFRWDGSAYSQVLEQQVNPNAGYMPAAVADLDGDGKNELIIVDGDIDIFRYSTDSKVFVKVGSIPGTAYNFTSSFQVSVGDVDGDGRPEVIALPSIYEYDPNPSAETGMLIIGYNGSTYTIKAQLSGFPHGLGGAAVADFDGDRNMEIIAAVGDHNIPTHPIYLVKYNGSGYVVTQIGTSYPGTFQAHAGDIDGDGIADANIQLNGCGSYFVTYKSGQYQVSFVSGGGAVFGDVADVDGNGKAEIVMASYSELDVFSWNPPASGSTSAMRALPGIVAYISKLPDGAFKTSASVRRHALIDSLNHSQSQYRSGDVASALKTIDQNVTSHLVVRTRQANDLWLADQVAQATLLRMIDDLVIAMKKGATLVDGVQLAEDDAQALPTVYCLYQNYPNPFNPTTQIAFDLPKDGNVSLVVHNILGQEVARLMDGYMPAGSYTVAFVADRLSAGVYYYVLRAGEYRSVKKMLLLK